ncbi:TetR/AcrR family transcriptional regulator [Streptococcus massiliensis]|uniref:TetR family transcriptional regulator n=1 Tax=Streptococcus massiliensis TaxID=313439 RepID=A0A380L0L1_9STRE|nr:TetR/AcrR family transcriptional regulator [Streptococcus massiliensis]SUN76270.1 TetR family transcriptional regulator [Streptococcus massiliensis]
MDRRVKKSRAAIYHSFISLLNQKSYEKITVQEIIDLADVGRSTFYTHFETKENLLEELCQDLFQHTFIERQSDGTPFDMIAHIFYHFQKNQDKIATLLLSKNMYFTRRLKLELEHYLFPLVQETLSQQKSQLPDLFLKNYVTTTFIETVTWWLEQRDKVDETTITNYFLALIN